MLIGGMQPNYWGRVYPFHYPGSTSLLVPFRQNFDSIISFCLFKPLTSSYKDSVVVKELCPRTRKRDEGESWIQIVLSGSRGWW